MCKALTGLKSSFHADPGVAFLHPLLVEPDAMGAASSAELPEIFLPAEMFVPDYNDAADDLIDHPAEKAEEDSSPLAFLWK